MGKKIIKLFILGMFAWIIFGCGSPKVLSSGDWYNLPNNGKLYTVYDIPVTMHELDSICVADTLSNNLYDWLNSHYIEFGTKDTVFKYTFIKHMGSELETIYVISEFRDSLSINKRQRIKK